MDLKDGEEIGEGEEMEIEMEKENEKEIGEGKDKDLLVRDRSCNFYIVACLRC